MKQLDLVEAIEARDKALGKVADKAGDWIDTALAILPHIRHDSAFVTGEDVRLWLEERISKPHHHNAYGALIRIAIRHGILRPTDKWVQMRTKKSHARMTRVYETW